MSWEIILSSLISAVLSGIILLVIKLGQKKAKEDKEDNEERGVLTLEALNANFAINKELVRCARGAKPNGELSQALTYQREVKHKLDDYIRRKASR